MTRIFIISLLLILLASSTLSFRLRSKVQGPAATSPAEDKSIDALETELTTVEIPVVEGQTTIAEAFEKARECYALECNEDDWDCRNGLDLTVCLSELGK